MPDVNIHRTDYDFVTGNLEGSPRLRANRSVTLALNTTWQRIDYNGNSAQNVNTFPMVEGQAYPVLRYDSANKLFLFSDPVDRNYNVNLYFHFVSSGLFPNAAQMRFIIPNGVSPGVPLYFPFPDDGGFKDLCSFNMASDLRVTESTNIFVNNAMRANGLGVEIKLATGLILAQAVNMTSAAILFFGR